MTYRSFHTSRGWSDDKGECPNGSPETDPKPEADSRQLHRMMQCDPETCEWCEEDRRELEDAQNHWPDMMEDG